MRVLAVVTGLLLFVASSLLAVDPVATSNAESCDISVLPAATLLLPYFEVDTAAAPGTGTTTLFTITNTSRYPQIAHVTVWTDWAFPVLTFDLFLTGYDVQGINLFDVIVRGFIAPSNTGVGTSITTAPGSPQNGFTGNGATPFSNTSNPNFVNAGTLDVNNTCADLPARSRLQPEVALAVVNALRSGVASGLGNCGSSQIGFNHGPRATGYVTIDVVSHCSMKFPTDADGSYFAGPDAPLLFDNVLFGDYQQIGPTPAGSGLTSTFDAAGNPMVHIRAVPEGGLSGAGGGQPIETNLPFTFYDRYTPLTTRTADRRQPLPSVWAARYIQGGAANFATDLKIWREGITSGRPDCAGVNGVERNRNIEITNVIRFDEHENAYAFTFTACAGICSNVFINLPATSRTPTTSSSVFPVLTGNDVGGWLYVNLGSGALDALDPSQVCHATLSAQRSGFGKCFDAPLGRGGSRTTSQNWVISSMFGAAGINRLSVDSDALALGNGCSPAPPAGAVIGPANHPSGSLVCPSNAKPGNCSPATRPPAVNP